MGKLEVTGEGCKMKRMVDGKLKACGGTFQVESSTLVKCDKCGTIAKRYKRS